MTNQIKCDLARRGAEITVKLARAIVLAHATEVSAKVGIPTKWLKS